jgi:hypothetical protein
MSKIEASATHDLYAEVKQSASDKVVESVLYPFTALEQNQGFPGCTKLAEEMAAEENAPFYVLTSAEVGDLLSAAVRDVRASQSSSEATVSGQVYAFAGDIIQQAKHVIDAASAAGSEYEGPDVANLQGIVDGGIEGLVNTLGDWGIYAWCTYLRVIVESRPEIALSSPRINLNDIEIKVTATGELWSKYPWWKCYKWCTKWEKVIKCDRIASITVSPKIRAEAHALLKAEAAKVYVQGVFDRLRLNYPILDKIPLEGLANKALKQTLVYVFDASKFVAVVPILESKFTVGTVTLPASADDLNVGISLRQVR